MLSIDVLLTFSLSALILSLSPGPSNLYIMATTLAGGGRAGIKAASGMAIGSIIYVVLTALGLGLLIAAAPDLFTAIKVAGSLYLIYLGVKTVMSARAPDLHTASNQRKTTFRQSIIVELTNPKTALFFIAFLPQFTQPERGDTTQQFILLGLIYSVIAFSSDTLVVVLSKSIKALLTRSPAWAVRQEQFAGTLLILLGVFIGADILADHIPALSP